MRLYSAADLHSNNHFLSILDEQDKRILEKRLPNDLSVTLRTLEPYRSDIAGIAVESTFNWYWLVDGLMEAGYPVMLVNTSKVKQYEGLKHTDDGTMPFGWLICCALASCPSATSIPRNNARCATCCVNAGAWFSNELPTC
jgi:hypothetical protein